VHAFGLDDFFEPFGGMWEPGHIEADRACRCCGAGWRPALVRPSPRLNIVACSGRRAHGAHRARKRLRGRPGTCRGRCVLTRPRTPPPPLSPPIPPSIPPSCACAALDPPQRDAEALQWARGLDEVAQQLRPPRPSPGQLQAERFVASLHPHRPPRDAVALDSTSNVGSLLLRLDSTQAGDRFHPMVPAASSSVGSPSPSHSGEASSDVSR
jgi:hypothetical protein